VIRRYQAPEPQRRDSVGITTRGTPLPLSYPDLGVHIESWT
jgi:hypothetical protein